MKHEAGLKPKEGLAPPKAGPAPFRKLGVIACGALAADVRRIARRRGWDVEVHPVPALLHNRPERIAPAVAAELSGWTAATSAWPSPTPTAAPTERWTSSA